MINLLKLEAIKLQRKFLLIVAFLIVMYLFVICFINFLFFIARHADQVPEVINAQMLNEYTLTYTGIIALPIAIILIFQTGHEFENKIVQKNISSGLSRGKYILSKLIFTILVAIFFWLVYLLYSFIFKYYLDYLADVRIGELLSTSVGVFYMALAFGCLAFLFTFLLKDSKKALAFFFVYLFVENLIYTLATKIYQIDLPTVLPLKLLRSVMFNESSILYLYSTPSLQYLTFSVLYSVAFITIAYIHFKKADLPHL